MTEDPYVPPATTGSKPEPESFHRLRLIRKISGTVFLVSLSIPWILRWTSDSWKASFLDDPLSPFVLGLNVLQLLFLLLLTVAISGLLTIILTLRMGFLKRKAIRETRSTAP